MRSGRLPTRRSRPPRYYLPAAMRSLPNDHSSRLAKNEFWQIDDEVQTILRRELVRRLHHTWPALVIVVADEKPAWSDQRPINLQIARDLLVFVRRVDVHDASGNPARLKDPGGGHGGLRHRDNEGGNAMFQHIGRERLIEVRSAHNSVEQLAFLSPVFRRAEERIDGDHTAIELKFLDDAGNVDGRLPLPDTDVDEQRVRRLPEQPPKHRVLTVPALHRPVVPTIPTRRRPDVPAVKSLHKLRLS